MDKFPGDVETAEKLTGGDPNILRQEKFCPEEKPDISALFGEKKIPKKRRDREDGHRRSDGSDLIKKITHPRFSRGESDHEVRIRQQPGSLPSISPNMGSSVYRCHICSFTSSRVNVIICHIKSHRLSESPSPQSKTYSQSHSRISDVSTPKRKYVKKEKSQSSRKKSESGEESSKRKSQKQSEKSSKKKKIDPKLKEKLLADWDDEELDDDTNGDVNTSSLNSSLNSSSVKNISSADESKEYNEEDNKADTNEIMTETEKLLKETEDLSIKKIRDSLDYLHTSKNIRFDRKFEAEHKLSEKGTSSNASNETKKPPKKDASSSDSENKNASDKDDKKSRLSCFDFDEDDLSEPSIQPVRKIPRVFGEKSLSLKKEIIKEFEMSQALKNEIKRNAEKMSELDKSMDLKAHEIIEIIQGTDTHQEKKETKANEELDEVVQDKTEVKKAEDEKTDKKQELVQSENDQQKSSTCETEVEIVEIFEVEREDADIGDNASLVTKDTEKEITSSPSVSVKSDKTTKNKDKISVDIKSDDKLLQSTKTDSEENVITESNDTSTKETEDTMSERCTTETEDETVSESAETMVEQSENSDIDMLDRSIDSKLSESRAGQTLKKRGRGRPRKNARSTSRDTNVEKSPKVNRSNKRFRMSERFELERKTSDSDTDRSYSGRRRKPNKKYLESDIYVSDPDYKALRTDESQSESETVKEKIVSKPKRGRRPKGVDTKSSSELVVQMDKQEIEVSYQTDSQNNVSSIDIKQGASESNVSKKLTFSEEKISEETKHDILEESVKSPNKAAARDDINTLSEVTTVLEANKVQDVQLNLDKTFEEKVNEKDKEDILKQDNENEEDINDQETSSIKAQTEDIANKIETPRDTTKINVDMLPPKKSQIKKFELSQIELLDTDVQTTQAMETKPESESKIDPEPKIEAEPERQVVPEPVSVPQPEAKTDVEEKINIENQPEVKTVIKTTDEIIKSSKTENELQETVESFKETSEKSVEKKQEIESVKETPKKDVNQSEIKSPAKSSSTISQADDAKNVSKSPTKTTPEQGIPKKSSMQTRYKGRFTPETGKGRKDLFSEEKPSNTFQEAFLKTLEIDKKTLAGNTETSKGRREKRAAKKKAEETDTNVTASPAKSTKLDESSKDLEVSETIQPAEENILLEGNIQRNTSNLSIDMSNIENTEVVVEENVEIDTKIGDNVLTIDQLGGSSPSEFAIASNKSSLQSSTSLEDNTKNDDKKLDKTPQTSVPISSLSSDISMPVKKREMPRIIENVTLTEPVQILKTKLLDKTPQKGVKHKLEIDAAKKGASKAKVMKIDTSSSNSKVKTVKSSVTSSQLPITKKLQVLKTEEVETLLDAQNKEQNTTPTTIVTTPVSSQNLVDMEFDINSMPFVLSDDMLTPEQIEQMPVVISSIIPASGSIPSTLSLTPTTQIMSPTQTQFKIVNETPTTEPSPSPSPKKKSGMPAILKSKSKAKPTITSVKTVVPPLTGGVKGLKFQSAQPVGKTTPVLAQKSPTPGKYVIVQTASGQQQLRQVVQSKSSTSQKVILPPNISKTITSGAQLIQQGGKVVILTSGQSQAKMVPVNISKTLSGKMQKIVTSKGQQLLCPISPQGSIITSKTPKVIAPKGDAAAATAVSPTTSKLVSGQKIISTTFTPISGTVTKLGTLSQGILTKGGVYTPITAISGKTIISSKALVTKGTTLLSAQGQSLGGTKTILTPVSQAITGKTILGTPTIVSNKGTILTPISGQQMKTIVTKSPTKSGKVQYQQVQHKVQILQKSPKATTTAGGSQGRTSAKLSGSTLILQTASPAAGIQKSTPQSKKIVKQTVQPTAIQNIASPSSAQPTVTIMQQVQPKGKTATTQKVIIPRTGSRQTKAQQKMAAQKAQESMSTVQNILPKTIVATSTNMSTPTKTVAQSKQAPTISKSPAKSQTSSKAQKNLMNVPMNSMSTVTTTASIATTVPLPPLEPIDADKKAKTNVQPVDSAQKKQIEKFQPEKSADTEKVEETKVVTQPQIMALPTESSDGTQTYVLVTIDEQGQIQPLDNNALMSLEGTTQNPDGTRTLYIDPSSLGETGTLDNIVLQFDNGILPNIQTNVTEASQTAIITESFPASEVIQTSNQDILAAALANTDFQQEISLSESQTGSVMTQTGLTQTSLINQTILQSTIIPPTEPISSPSVLETSLTLNQPIMTPLEVPSNVSIQSKETASTSVVSTIPSSLELPITITNPNISYISTAGETQIQIPGNSMPDIGEIIEDPTATTTGEIVERTEIPVSTQYLVIPNLEETQSVQGAEIAITPSASYTVTMSNNIVLESSQVQTTPSMPIIDDAYTDNSQFNTTIVTDQAFVDVPVSEMLVSKAPAENVQSQDVTVTSEMISSHEVPSSPQKSIISTNEVKNLDKEQTTTMQQVFSSQEVPITSEELILQQSVKESSASSTMEVVRESEGDTKESNTPMTSLPIIDESTLVRSESNSMEQVNFDVTDSSELKTAELHEADAMDKLKQLTFSEESDSKVKQQVGTSNQIDVQATSQVLLNPSSDATMEVDETIDEPSSQEESDRRRLRQSMELRFADEEEATNTETSQEVPSQSQYEQFNVPVSNDSVDLPSQSANKLESSSGEATQSITYEPMEVDEEAVVTEPPTQSFEHSKNEASQSYEASVETNINAPTQSFNEIAQSDVERPCADETIDDQSFPTQSYEVDKSENMTENLETDAEISQEGNIPSQSNDIGADGIGTSSVSTNNSGLNEDETASSSYVPETPENQERDQDQESAISTSSYEIPPCEELNIASSSVIPDTSVSTEHTSIRDNGVPEIPTSSSYSLNPDITSTHHVDSVPTSSYEDQVIVEQNVSTSYEVPISMPGLDETCSQNFVPESTDHHRNEPSSYYAHHQEVTESYYESVDQDTNSRLEEDPHEEHVTPGGYYEGNPQEVSQSYFTPAEETTNYSNQGISPGYYDPNRPESEASQSYYSTDDLDGKTEQSSSSPNIEASQSFYQERSGELRLRQQGEATPTYSEGYPADYTLENSPIERHDLVESSVPATRSMDR
ncbi:mucin-17-like [Pseudomyrmex gracilis]|uniref:mucin-17-like n=1 Tax=Pseudomyrmex gracilis TaxID=219809 RepID=UPI0009957689|nr:mucin-17-like [Pseudomyrmex gracilis]